MSEWNLSTGWDDEPIQETKLEAKEQIKEKRQGSARRHTECLELSLKYEYRRAFSETKLLDACDKFDFKNGHSYNFITAGDVDSLSYLKAILRQQNLDYCLLSTWCMAAEDIFQIGEWIKNGLIKKMDFYVGEIFPNSYKIEFAMVKKLIEETKCGRVAVFCNHSKIYAGYGNKFYFGIQTSANINTNPRTENGNITIDKTLFDFYKQYFDGIKSFEK